MNSTPIQNALANVMAQALATGLFVSLCTIQAPSGNVSDSGQPDLTYVDMHVDIRCMNAPNDVGSIEATENRQLPQIAAESYRHVLLDGPYQDIVDGVGDGWRAVFDGTMYDIEGAEIDSQTVQTRLFLNLTTV